MNKLPIYKAIVGNDVETGMITISLVDAPAVEVDFLYFDEDKKPLSFAVEDEEQRKVLGVVMTADKPIYRNDGGYEYYIVFDRQTIEKMAEKYLRYNKHNNVDLMHNFILEDGIYLNEFFIKDTAKGINPTGFEEVNDGSLFAIFHVQNDEIWNAIKEGTFKGFSLSGYFDSELVQFNKIKEENKFMTKLKKIKQVLRNLLVEMGEVSTDKGLLLWDGDEDIKVGDAVKGIDEEGNEIEVADGDYTTEDGKVIVVADGKVAEIKEPEEMPAEEPTEEEKPIEAEGEPNEEPTEPSNDSEDEKDARIKELEELIKAKDTEIEELKAKIAELENEPAAKPAEEEFAKAEAKEDNSPKGKMVKRGYKL